MYQAKQQSNLTVEELNQKIDEGQAEMRGRMDSIDKKVESVLSAITEIVSRLPTF